MKSSKFTKLASVLLILAITLSLVACGTASNTSGSTNSDSARLKSTETTTAVSSTEDTKADPFGKYDPAIEVTATRWTGEGIKYAEGETLDNNKFTKILYEDTLGIKVKYLWSTPQAQFDQKMTVSIASNDLPDLIRVKMKHLKMLADGDKILDLTDIYNKYASPTLKKCYEGDNGTSLGIAKIDGKLMAIPTTASPMDVPPVLWIRTDWLKNVNLSEPKNMNDLFAVIDAFTNKDPDGNGKKDTYGLSLCKDLLDTAQGGWMSSLTGFFAGYRAYPNSWIKDAQGNLVYGGIQPEVKEALKKIQELYNARMIDKEFAVKDGGKIAEDIAKGKVGLMFGAMWNSLWPLQDAINKDPKSDWKAFPIVSIDDKSAAPSIGINVETMDFLVVNKNAKHPEAAVKLANVSAEEFSGFLFGDEAYREIVPSSVKDEYAQKGITEPWQYQLFPVGPANKNLTEHLSDIDVLDGIKPLSKALQTDINDINAFEKDGKRDKWGFARVFGHEGSYSIINKYYNIPENYIWDEFYGAPTQTMAEKFPTLNKLQQEVYTKIVMGDPIDSFDKFAEDWSKLGGDIISKEVNDWYKTKK